VVGAPKPGLHRVEERSQACAVIVDVRLLKEYLAVRALSADVARRQLEHSPLRAIALLLGVCLEIFWCASIGGAADALVGVTITEQQLLKECALEFFFGECVASVERFA
jgi:hypothetical protein